MKRTTISLPDDLAAALEREAARRRVPVSQVAREALEARLGWSATEPRDLPFAAIGASSDGRSIAEDDEAFLRASWPADIEIAADIDIDADAGGR
jgi:predicted transcriptional regulator